MSLSLYDAQILSTALKKARAKKHLTQATCAELLEHSFHLFPKRSGMLPKLTEY